MGVGISAFVLVVALVSPGVAVLYRMLACIFGLAVGWLWVWRLALAGVYVRAEGVRLVNPWQTRSIPWNDVRAFTLERWGLFPAIGVVELTDGSRIPIFGIEAPNPLTRPRNRDAQKLIDELNHLLAMNRPAGLPS
jgi:hypothetical protein